MQHFNKGGGWEDYARCYDALLHLRPYRDMLHALAARVREVGANRILDASCGTGNFEHFLSEAVTLGDESNELLQICAVDGSKEMLARAKGKAFPGICTSFTETNLNHALNFGAGCFDTVVSINTLYATESPNRVLAEFCRVLENGGRFFLVTPRSGYENGLILKEHARSVLPDSFWLQAHSSPEREELLIREAIKDEAVVAMMLLVAHYNREIARSSVFHFFEQEQLLQLVADAGFLVTKCEYVYANQGIYIEATKNGGK